MNRKNIIVFIILLLTFISISLYLILNYYYIDKESNKIPLFYDVTTNDFVIQPITNGVIENQDRYINTGSGKKSNIDNIGDNN